MSFPEGQLSQAFTFLCSGGLVAGWDWLWCGCWWMCSVPVRRHSTFQKRNVGFLIRPAFTGSLSTFWAHSISGAGWFREHIDAISSSMLSDGIKEQRWEGDEQQRRCMECLRDRERSRCCLCSQCVCVASSLGGNLHSEECSSAPARAAGRTTCRR